MSKQKQKTKEELVKEVAVLEAKIERMQESEKNMRKDFARAFGWSIRKSTFGYSKEEEEVKVPVWSEIFVEVGKLLAARNFMDLEGNVSELECKVEAVIGDFKKIIKPDEE